MSNLLPKVEPELDLEALFPASHHLLKAEQEAPKASRNCAKCLESESQPTVLDKSPDGKRAWGSAEQCLYCDEIDSAEAAHTADDNDLLIPDSPEDRPFKLQAYFMMRLEGAAMTRKSIAARTTALKACFATIPASQSLLPRPQAPESKSGCSSASVGDAVRESCVETPPKIKKAKKADEDLESAQGSLPGSLPSHSGRMSTQTSSVRSASGPSLHAASMPKEEEDDDDEVVDPLADGSNQLTVTAWSVDAPFPVSSLGTSISRMRKTTNEYVDKCCRMGWFSSWRAPTMKAARRRQMQQSKSVAHSLHVDIMEGYRQIRVRLHALICFHKRLTSWQNNSCDIALVGALEHSEVLGAYLKVREQKWAPDLEIVLYKASFVTIFKQTGSLHVALQCLDKKSIHESYQRLADMPPAGEAAQDDNEEDVEQEEHAPIERTRATRATSKKAATPKGRSAAGNRVLSLPEKPLLFYVSCVDKAAQLRLGGNETHVLCSPHRMLCLKLPQVASSCLKLLQVACSASSCFKLCKCISDCLKLSEAASSCFKLPQAASSCLTLLQDASSCLKLLQAASL